MLRKINITLLLILLMSAFQLVLWPNSAHAASSYEFIQDTSHAYWPVAIVELDEGGDTVKTFRSQRESSRDDDDTAYYYYQWRGGSFGCEGYHTIYNVSGASSGEPPADLSNVPDATGTLLLGLDAPCGNSTDEFDSVTGYEHTSISIANAQIPGVLDDPTAIANANATCENSNNNVSWLLCPVVEGAADNIGGIMGFVSNQLEFDVGPADSSNGTFRVWSGFKSIANIFFLVALIVVVYAQATGSMLDAYSVKKMLPRLVISAIAVQLSFFFSSLAIELTNELGRSLYIMIENLLNINLGFEQGSYVVLAVVGAAVIGIGGAFIGLFAITPIILGLLIMLIAVVFTFVFRSVLLTALVILSPLAFIAWILPGTEKYFKLWWQNFSKLLLMYPMIILLIEAGRIMAVASSGGNADDIGFMGMLFMFAPWMMIPFTFKFAGSAIASIGSYADKIKGQTKEGARRRAEPEMQKRKQEFFAGSRGSNRGLGKYINKAGLAAGVLPKSITKPSSFSGRMQTAQGAAAAARADDPAFKQMSVNSYAMAASALGKDYIPGQIDKQKVKKSELDSKLAAGKLSADEHSQKTGAIDQTIAAMDQGSSLASSLPNTNAQRQASLMALAATGFEFEAGQKGYNRLQEAAVEIAGGSTADIDEQGIYRGKNAGLYSNIMNESQFNLRRAGRFDLGGINHGAGYSYEKGLGKADSYTIGRGATETIQAGREIFGAEAAPDKKITTAELQTQATSHLSKALQTGSNDKIRDTMRWRAQLRSAKRGATGQNLDEINTQLTAIDGAIGSVGVTAGPTPDGRPIITEDGQRQRQVLKQAMLEGERYVDTYDSEQTRNRGGIDPDDPHLHEDES